ncbi:Pheromone shutdown protein [Methanosarcina siciliae C2J]|uniref:Pheromone shutdown protein n=4 Tax=Methanosarcina siciliae TaxID=38027 RepID=A0A0E3PJP6_9EURY|nr:Pheromone shutdown protein [Methanosarcina siciliae T4/M]AKB34522.1 Pheromone shutdown protein [Methanosarcina siciliae HI350]AKB38921.1 Pheromone shutdown protein [Methanosarcina siciliae C2J]
MDKLITESTEDNVSVGKSKLSDSSINKPEDTGISIPSSVAESGDPEVKLDISSELIAEPLPDSAAELFVPSSIQPPALDGSNPAVPFQPSKVVLIGTAHVSEKSVAEVRNAIRNLKPDIVAVELCRARYDSLKGNIPETNQLPIKEILSEGKVYYYLVHWLLAYVQKKIGNDMGVKPGAEMLSAIAEAEASGARVALIDRDIQVTLQRFWGRMKFTEKIKMLGSLIGGLIGIGGSEIDIDQITQQDVVTALVSELREFAPTAAETLIDERDAYLAGSILRVAAGGNKTIVAVIGAGHKPGVTNYLKNPKSIPPFSTLMELPKKRIGIGKIVGFGIVGLAILVFLLLIASGTPLKLLLIAFVWWFIINGVLSAAGALLAGGHPYSILTAFSVAWLTSLNPMMAAGWFAGLVEAKQRNPTTDDIKALAGIETFKEMFKNRFMRVLLVASFANIGSVIGTFLGAYVMMQVTGLDPQELLHSGFSALGL